MNNIYRTMVQGLRIGWSAIREGTDDSVDGIYLHGETTPEYCNTYTLYFPLQDSGFLWAPLIEVRFEYPDPLGCKTTGKKAGRATQYVTYPDCSCMAAVYFHIIHVSHTRHGSRHTWYNVEPIRPREMEIPPEESDAAIEARSVDRYSQWEAELLRLGRPLPAVTPE